MTFVHSLTDDETRSADRFGLFGYSDCDLLEKPIADLTACAGMTHSMLVPQGWDTVLFRDVRPQRELLPSFLLTEQTLRCYKEPPPAPLRRIDAAIEASRSILELPDDWDDEGSPGYSKAVWELATRFVRDYAERAWERRGTTIPAPRILPGPNGSIDIHWDTLEFELLINIPGDSSHQASFYGDDRVSQKIKGTIDLRKSNDGLLLWLTKQG